MLLYSNNMTQIIKNLIILVLVLVLASTLAIAATDSVLDEDCQSYGYDFGIARWIWNSQDSQYEQTLGNEDYDTLVSGTNEQASWMTTGLATGILSNEECFVQVLPGGESGAVSVYDSEYKIQFITLCADKAKEDLECEQGNCDDNQIEEVPEFGTLTALAVLIISGIFIMKKRKESK